ncbi:hypothetical protein HPB51_007301 [Rhipicephalus microplus]|uniref:Endonuclease/exonuclease/phosphatase domain-containing protein n=1 Tax=Rhipicephalus microplus TaxID=6941 RepID=A0A9J6EQX6_RHIMP|nr:hypothetical protein HPB51_007301 [Rhipicephalus microplus]
MPHSLAERLGGASILCDDFNSHHAAWKSASANASGRAMMDATLMAGCHILNEDSLIFVRPGAACSALGLFLVSDVFTHGAALRTPWSRTITPFTPAHSEPGPTVRGSGFVSANYVLSANRGLHNSPQCAVL